MKKAFYTFTALLLLTAYGCQKENESNKDFTIAKKYAKYRVSVYKEKEMKSWLATLEKAEDVSLLSEESIKDPKSKTGSKDISKIQLADDSTGYIESQHLADKPIVFVTDTKAFVRPTTGTKVIATIPKGELGFIIEEKGSWVQVYVGKIDGKYITRQWVEENSFTADTNIVLQAKEFAIAVDSLKSNDPEKISRGKELIEKLSGNNSVIAELAKEKLNESGAGEDDAADSEEPLMEEEISPDNADM